MEENDNGQSSGVKQMKQAKPVKQSYKFFNNNACQYYPCHEEPMASELNCLFCYCPLYAMGKNCGGDFKYTKKGVKSCTNCDLPHIPGNYDLIITKLEEWGPSKC